MPPRNGLFRCKQLPFVTGQLNAGDKLAIALRRLAERRYIRRKKVPSENPGSRFQAQMPVHNDPLLCFMASQNLIEKQRRTHAESRMIDHQARTALAV